MSVMCTVMIGLIVLLRKLAGDKLSPGCYLFLWMLAGLRLLVPIRVVSPFSIYQLLLISGETAATLQKITYSLQEGNLPTQWLTEPFTLPTTMERAMQWEINWMCLLWLAGCAITLFVILYHHRKSRNLYAISLPAEDDFIRSWMASHPLRRTYQVRYNQRIAVPLTYGVLRPVILLPPYQSISEEELDMMLQHEWNHIRHGDILWQWLLVFLCSIHWFNPAVWLMMVLCRQDLELCCDCATVQQLQHSERKTYALLLLQQAANTAPPTPFFSQFCFTGYQSMEERIQRIMKYKKMNWKTIIMTVALLCVGILVFATSPSGEVYAENHEQSGEDAAITMQWPVDADSSKITLAYGTRIHPITKEEMNIDHICIGEAEQGTAIVAAASGTVKEIGFDANRGHYLVIQHTDNVETQYWHCEKILIGMEAQVAKGEIIATLGQTGSVTGPCLGFAVYRNGEVTDPIMWFE